MAWVTIHKCVDRLRANPPTQLSHWVLARRLPAYPSTIRAAAHPPNLLTPMRLSTGKVRGVQPCGFHEEWVWGRWALLF